MFTFLFFNCSSFEKKKSNREQIRNAFKDWCETKIREGEFFGSDSCNPAYYLRDDSVGIPNKKWTKNISHLSYIF